MARVVEEDEFADMPGQDSFLDVLTNIVGIIILLVVVVGLRTSRSVVQAAVEKVQAVDVDDSALKELAAAQAAAIREEKELDQITRQVIEIGSEAVLRQKERNYLTTYVTAFDQELKDRREELTVDQQRDFDLRRQLAEAQEKLENVSREQVALLSQPTEVEAIENQPTPLARRSTGKEVLLYLSGGHLAVIPNELVTETINDVKGNLWRLKDRQKFTGTVGPINGFRLKYLVGLLPVEGGVGDPNIPGGARAMPHMARAELLYYEIMPETPTLGVPVEQAVAPNSELRQVLRENPADTAVVVIAVYPDSIAELQSLKRELYAAGYATAAVPCVAGRPLRGSPRAPRSGQIFAQ